MQPEQQQGGQAPQARQAPPEPFRRRLGNFLARTVNRFRFVLLGILIAAAAFLVGYFIYNEINKKLIRDSTVLSEGAQDLFDTWQSEQDAAKKAGLEKDLRDQLDRLVARYPRQYGGQRGLFLRADLNFEGKSWDAAIKDSLALAERFPASYLAPISLFNAAVSNEEKGDRDSALALYVKVSASYKDSAVAPRALFNAGRIDEEKGGFEEARKKYEQLDADYPFSSWAKLAKNRVIALKVQGKIK